jgi:hypothetical protein
MLHTTDTYTPPFLIKSALSCRAQHRCISGVKSRHLIEYGLHLNNALINYCQVQGDLSTPAIKRPPLKMTGAFFKRCAAYKFSPLNNDQINAAMSGLGV